MTENRYRVVLTGKVADGKSENEVAARMAGLFKTSPEKISALLKKSGTVIKKDIPLALAKKYAGAVMATGAICVIDPPVPAPSAGVSAGAGAATPAAAPPERDVVAEPHNDRAEPRVVVIPLSKKPEDRFTPLQIPKISGAPEGIDLNTPDVAPVTYDQIMALAAFSETSDTEAASRVFIYIKKRPAPFLCRIDRILYEDFPVKEFPKNTASFRGFLHFLCRENPSIILEETTLDFLSGSQPQVLDPGKMMKLATGMGLLIESGDIDAQT